MNIAYYVSGHGFGHISRSYEVVKYLLEKKEVSRIFINSTRKDFIKDKKENLIFRDVAVDVGMIQQTSISLDVPKTLEAIFEFERIQKQIIEQEISFLKQEKIDLVISDSSSLPFVIADKLDLPSYFVGNFTWDFIYQNYINVSHHFQRYANSLREEYALCKFGFILPFHCPMHSIPKKKNIGIVGRKTSLDRQTIREMVQFSPENKYFLFSFGAYGISEELDFGNLQDNEWIVVSGYEGLTGEKVIDVNSVDYPSLVKACDYVLTKPGYGILSESYLANTAVIYTDRGDFAEYPYFVNALSKFHYSAYLPQKDLLSFNLKTAVFSINAQRNTKKIPQLLDGRQEVFLEIF